MQYENELFLKRPNRSTIRTKDGVSAVFECIDFLKSAVPVMPLHWNKSIAMAAKDHVQDIGPKGLVSHSGSEKIKDGANTRDTNAKDRLKKHGSIISCYGENLSFHCIEAKEILISLLVDDGSKSRGHRNNILNSDFNYMGCFTG